MSPGRSCRGGLLYGGLQERQGALACAVSGELQLLRQWPSLEAPACVRVALALVQHSLCNTHCVTLSVARRGSQPPRSVVGGAPDCATLNDAKQLQPGGHGAHDVVEIDCFCMRLWLRMFEAGEVRWWTLGFRDSCERATLVMLPAMRQMDYTR